jgi:hypothetical protein
MTAPVSPSTADGILLYPLTDEPIDVTVRVHSQSLRVRTFDFTRDWQEIHHELLELSSVARTMGFPASTGLHIGRILNS